MPLLNYTTPAATNLFQPIQPVPIGSAFPGGASAPVDPNFQRQAMWQAIMAIAPQLMSLDFARDPGGTMGRGLSSGMQVYQQQMLQAQQLERQRQQDEMARQQFAATQDWRHRQIAEQDRLAAERESRNEAFRGIVGDEIAKGRLSPQGEGFVDPRYSMSEALMQSSPELAYKLLGPARVSAYEERKEKEEEVGRISSLVARSVEMYPELAPFVKGATTEEELDLGLTIHGMYQREKEQEELRGLRSEVDALSRGTKVFETARKLKSDWTVKVQEGEVDKYYVMYPGNEEAGLPAKRLDPSNPGQVAQINRYAILEARKIADPEAYQRDLLEAPKVDKVDVDDDTDKKPAYVPPTEEEKRRTYEAVKAYMEEPERGSLLTSLGEVAGSVKRHTPKILFPPLAGAWMSWIEFERWAEENPNLFQDLKVAMFGD